MKHLCRLEGGRYIFQCQDKRTLGGGKSGSARGCGGGSGDRRRCGRYWPRGRGFRRGRQSSLVFLLCALGTRARGRDGRRYRRDCRRWRRRERRRFVRLGRIQPSLAHVRPDVRDLEPRLVVADRRGSRGVIDGHAFDTRHVANPLFHPEHAQDREHVAHFDNARFHDGSFVDLPASIACDRPATLISRALSFGSFVNVLVSRSSASGNAHQELGF